MVIGQAIHNPQTTDGVLLAKILLTQFTGMSCAYFTMRFLWQLGMVRVHGETWKETLECMTPLDDATMWGNAFEEFLLMFIYLVFERLVMKSTRFGYTVKLAFCIAWGSYLVYFGLYPSGAFFNPSSAFAAFIDCYEWISIWWWIVYLVAPVLGVMLCNLVLPAELELKTKYE